MSNPGDITILPVKDHHITLKNYGAAWTIPNESNIDITVPSATSDKAIIVAIDGQKLDEPIVLTAEFGIGLDRTFRSTSGKSMVIRGTEVYFHSAEVKIHPGDHYLVEPEPKPNDDSKATGWFKWGMNGEQEFSNNQYHFIKPSDGN
ncbi:hypothetical protein TWF281_010241 [Arthrobotrys megalospora]